MILRQQAACKFVISAWLFSLASVKAFADMPLPPAEPLTVLSRDKKIEAESYPQTNETIVYRKSVDGIRGEILWKFPRWFRVFQISNDGNAMVAETDYVNILPQQIAQDDYVLLTFIVQGKVIREITVKQLLGARSKLLPTSEGLLWGHLYFEGMDPNGFVFVDTVVGFFIFDAKAAKCIFPPNNQIDSSRAH